MRILVTGSTGLIGSRLVPILLKAGHAVVATSRDPESIPRLPGVLPFGWDGQTMLQVPGKVDAIVHLAGESIVGKRWSEERKQALHDSRIVSAKRIAEFIARRRPAERPKVLVAANAVGYYGIRPEGVVLESTPAGTDFLAQLCKDWQAAAEQAETRVVVLRIGHVLSKHGGYLGALLPFARVGLAGPLGDGKQPLPWIHIDDLCGVILWSITNGEAKGVYNATAPQPAVQKDLVKAVNKAVLIPSLLPVPAFAMKLRFGEVSDAMLGGQNAPPARLEAEGYEFGHPQLREAVQSLLKPKPAKARDAKAAALARVAVGDQPDGDEDGRTIGELADEAVEPAEADQEEP